MARYGRRGRPLRLDIEELTRLYGEGISMERLGARFAVSSATIRRRLNAAGVEIRRPGIPTPPSSPETVSALYAAGYNMADIAQQLGISSATVMRRLRAAGVKSRPTGGRPTVLIDDAWCREMYREGHSVPEIAEWLGVPPTAVRASVDSDPDAPAKGTTDATAEATTEPAEPSES